ncbi:TlpA family protein disulfide reductase [Paenibacillus soyae]|uniref:TlpA family protein disulfide reductase n=1 Tax=Paenibacillus soyae TaxID=2969249 RepID=A0A9X2MSB3_9BACL|nr:TlpA disulfide reductase family protein [Paenibacillus soyae]MCR2805929.1 TlpA family protein disulfide reductase [Paenibacillus soyae]
MKMKLLYTVSGLLVVAWLGATAWIVFQFVEGRETPEVLEQVNTVYGGEMTDFTLEDQFGEPMDVSIASGKPKLINFWTSWCPGCQDEADDLNRIYEEYKDEIEIISVNVTTSDTMEDAMDFIEEYDVQMPVLFDLDGEVSGIYDITSIPTNYFVRADGTIEHITYELTEDNAEPFLQELLESGR